MFLALVRQELGRCQGNTWGDDSLNSVIERLLSKHFLFILLNELQCRSNENQIDFVDVMKQI